MTTTAQQDGGTVAQESAPYDSLQGQGSDDGHVSARTLQEDLVLEIERKGFCLLDLTHEASQ